MQHRALNCSSELPDLLRLETTTLHRPVGPKELALVRETGFRAFPPRLSWRPIFAPVLNGENATRIARDGNVRDSGSGYATQFAVLTSLPDR
jgi:hypothetical protein